MKTAIIQCADTGPLNSVVEMLRHAGYWCHFPSRRLREELRGLGCDTVLDPDSLQREWGYPAPHFPLQVAGPDAMAFCDLYVDVKAHRNGPLVWKRWPQLRNKTLWYRINGGRPEHVVKPDGFDCGDEVNPPCPVLTPNQWYAGWKHENGVTVREEYGNKYCCWPPFLDFDSFEPRGANPAGYPLCLVHNLEGWGYGKLAEPLRRIGVKMYGVGSPDGLVSNKRARQLLQGARAYVHLKSSDAPGYALYEALAAACPVICTRRLIWRCLMQDLLIPGETCLVFDRETHDPLSDEDVRRCEEEVLGHLEYLCANGHNRRIGEAGRRRLKEVMWSADRPADLESFREFMRKNFP